MTLVRAAACMAAFAVSACQSQATREAPPSQAAPTYAGHGIESVSREVLARFAPTPVDPAISAPIQAMLDVRAPGAGLTSQDGKRLYFTWNVTGVRQLWRIDGPQRFPVQMTGGEDPAAIAAVAPDDSYLVLQRDRNGEENPGLYWQDAAGGALHPVQHKKGVQTFFEFVSDDGRWIYFRANDAKPDSFVLYRWEKASGKREVVFDQEGLWSVADHRDDGRLLLEKALGSNQSEFWDYDPATRALVAVIGQGEREDYAVSFAAQKGEYLVLTPRLGEFRRLYRLKGKDLMPVTPDLQHDVQSASIDDPRERLYYEVNERGYTRLHVLDAKTYREISPPSLPRADHVSLAGVSDDGRYATLAVAMSNAPTTSYVLDWKTRKVTQWHLPSAPEIDPSRFVAATLESYPARDGAQIPMFVRRPRACATQVEPCPVIVIFHGGPESQARPFFSSTAQIFVDAGFVVAEPNVRGSDGYGRTWIHADDGPKRLEVVTDIEDASKYVRSAWAKDGRAPKVGIYGGSYGGYSSLAGMTMFAGAYDAGAEIVGISNLVTFLENTAPYRRKLRISEYGDPEKDREALIKLSPITHVDRIQGPMLLMQGANDPRVPVGEAVQIQQALEKKGLPNQLIIFADEGHGSQKRGNQALQIGHALLFFRKHLVGEAR
jgi:dipeptidyl aminopeptidase/acylaminoacyl peptidase